MEQELHCVRINKMINYTLHDNVHPMHAIILLTVYPTMLRHYPTNVLKRSLNLLEAPEHSSMLRTANN
jgi:hypothetical protein